MNVVGNIGEKLKLRLNWDTQTSFSFENQFKIEYQGSEDDIIKSIEAGNVGLPMGGTLITGGQNLWGIKTRLQFGSVFVTAIASQQRSKTQKSSSKPEDNANKEKSAPANTITTATFFSIITSEASLSGRFLPSLWCLRPSILPA